MSSGLLDWTYSSRVVSRLTDCARLSPRNFLIGLPTCPTLSALEIGISDRHLPTCHTARQARHMTRSRKLVSCVAVNGDVDSPLWDVVGLGQAMVDISASVEDDQLILNAGVDKGARK